MPADVSPGVELRRMGLEATLDRVLDTPGTSSASADPTLVQLHEDGDPSSTPRRRPTPCSCSPTTTISPPPSATCSRTVRERRVRVGPELLHADHTVSVVHNWLDTDGYESY